MSTLQRQLRACLAAILVAGLLLADVASGATAVAPCNDGEHHSTVATLGQVVQLEQSDAASVDGAARELARCCSTVINCCASAAILLGEVELDQPRIRSVWIPTTPNPLHGLGDKVNRHPPRLA